MASTPLLPKPLDKWLAATNRGDRKAFLALFPKNGTVDDFGRRFIGRDAIGAWSDKEYLGANGKLSNPKVEKTGHGVIVVADWASSVYAGPSRFLFVLEGSQVREMRIRGTNKLQSFFLDLRRLVTPPRTLA